MSDHNYYGNSGDHWNAAFNRYDHEPDDEPLCTHTAMHTCTHCGITHCPICLSVFDEDKGEYSCPQCNQPYSVLMQLMIIRINRQEESLP